MPVLSFLFRRIQWYHLPGLFGHSGCEVGNFLSFSMSVFISMSLIFIYLPFPLCLCLFLPLFLSSPSFSVPSFVPFCVFSLYNFLSSSLSKFSTIFRVAFRNLHFLPLFSFVPFCLSLYTFISTFTLFVFFVYFSLLCCSRFSSCTQRRTRRPFWYYNVSYIDTNVNTYV